MEKLVLGCRLYLESFWEKGKKATVIMQYGLTLPMIIWKAENSLNEILTLGTQVWYSMFLA